MKAPTLLQCPACGSSLSATDYNSSRGLAKCAHCGALMSLPPSATADEGARARPEVPLPPALKLRELPDGLEIRRRWFTPAVIFLILFCVVWDGFLVFWFGIATQTKAPWIMTLFPLVHVAAGVFLTYSAVAAIFNSTRIRLDFRELTIRHSPIPWPGNRRIAREDIDQLYCRRIVKQHGDSGPSTTYELWMTTHGGSARKLLGAGLEEQQALFVEQRLERALGIVDRRMSGELER